MIEMVQNTDNNYF